MSRSKRKPKGSGNIKAETAYDPFPKSGLVKQYEPFIRKHVGEFCKRYPEPQRDGVLLEAIRIASNTEKRFKPELGHDFSTPLRHALKGLRRYAKRETEPDYARWLPEEKRSNREFDEAEKREAAPIPTPEFLSGANGTRLTFDHQWIDGDGKRHRLSIGLQLNSADLGHAGPVNERTSPDLKALVADNPEPSPVLQGRMRAVIDHQVRRQREADQEAENRQNGDYGAVLLEAEDQKADVKFHKGRRPPRFRPERKAIVSLDEAYTHDDEWVSKLSETIAAGSRDEPLDARLIIDAGNAERPFLSKHQAAALDWMFGRMNETDTRSLVQFADDQGISKGYASKLQDQVIRKLQRRVTAKVEEHSKK
jgi:DNA-directed RNA polymerase specialized sigma subunit